MIALWSTFSGWWMRNPIAQVITAVVLALLGWEVIKRHLKEAGRQAERAAIAQKQAQVAAAVAARQTQIVQEETRSADQALQARDGVSHSATFDELPDDIKSVLDRSQRSGPAR